MHLHSAFSHRDLYYLNRFMSKTMPCEILTIMHDKMDYSKTTFSSISHNVKNLDGLKKFPLVVTDILSHGHVDQPYAHFWLDIF